MGSLQFGIKTFLQRILHKTVDTFDNVNLFIVIVRKLDFEFIYRFWGTLNSKKIILENFRMPLCPSKSLDVFWKNFQQTCILWTRENILQKFENQPLCWSQKTKNEYFLQKPSTKIFFVSVQNSHGVLYGYYTNHTPQMCLLHLYFYETIYK